MYDVILGWFRNAKRFPISIQVLTVFNHDWILHRGQVQSGYFSNRDLSPAWINVLSLLSKRQSTSSKASNFFDFLSFILTMVPLCLHTSHTYSMRILQIFGYEPILNLILSYFATTLKSPRSRPNRKFHF